MKTHNNMKKFKNNKRKINKILVTVMKNKINKKMIKIIIKVMKVI